ncbi:MAG: ATP-binding protein [Ignavibacteriales bacterium]|nr:MAG: ATP-binding protein [Ignavibacteriales bacterium]
MILSKFRSIIIFRISLISINLLVIFYLIFATELLASIIILSAAGIYQLVSLFRYVDKTNRELSKFLGSIKHSDFSQIFSTRNLGGSFKELGSEFNDIINRFQSTRKEKEENLRYLYTVIQHVGIGLFSFDSDGKIEFINNAAKKILKVSQLISIDSLKSINKSLAEKIESLNSGEKTIVKYVEDNELVQLMVHASSFKLKNQIYTIVSLQNIQSEMEEQEMDAWQKLIRVLTHEIMNSITPISSLAATANKILSDFSGSHNDINKEELEDIISANNTILKRSEGLLHFVNNYRNLTKIPRPVFQIISIKKLFERIETLMKKELKEQGIDFNCEVDPLSLELTADPDLIEQVLINLIINSQHALKDIRNAKISLTGSLDDKGKILIKVMDNGSGIPEDVQEKIFIPFFSTKRNGSGIGLSLSRQIIRAHGGTIRVNSVVGKETVFSLRF